MSEEGIGASVTLEKDEPDRRSIINVTAESSVSPSKGRSRSVRTFRHRASVGSLNPGNRERRYSSTGKSATSITSQNVSSRYLRASTGSCHDLCKYGMKHSPEEEKPKALRQKIHGKTSPVELNPVQIMVSGEGKNLEVFCRKPKVKRPTDMKSPSPKVRTHLDKEKAAKHHNASTDSIGAFRKPKISLDVGTSSSRQNKAPLPENKALSSRKFSSPDPPEMIKNVFFPSENAEAKVGQCSSAASEVPKFSKKTVYPSSQLSSLKSVKVKPAVLRSEKSDALRQKERKHSDAETHRNMAAKASAKKISMDSGASLSPKISLDKVASDRSRKAGSLKLASSPKVQNQVGGDNCNTSNDEKVLEKTLHIIETATENKALYDSISDDLAISSFPPPSPSSLKSWSHAESSSLLSQEEDRKEIEYSDCEPVKLISDNDEPLEAGSGLSIPNYHAVLSVLSSPEALCRAESPSLVFHKESDEEIDCSSGSPDKSIFKNQTLEIDTLQSVPVDRAIASTSSPFLHKSLSQAESSFSSPCEEDNREIKYLDGEAGVYIPNNDESLEIGNMQLDPDVPAISSFPSPESLSYAESASSSPYEEEDNKEIDHHDGDERCEYISEVDESPCIGNDHNISLFPSPPSPKSHSSSSSSHEEDIDEIEYSDGNDASTYNGNVRPPAAEDHKKTHRKSRAAITEDNYRSPVKLKFKPGRVIDLKSDNSGPRRLRFRRGRDLAAEHRKGESRTLKRSGGNSAVTAEETSSEKVVLKHQDVQDKKDSQILFNNVLEETASKLVESRKSKVKALVGAFETVISLQESKPSY